jgi:ubiquinone/menaquinone biosynthesis C-methylase UbiE
MTVEFTTHNIRLDNGTFTRPGQNSSMEKYALPTKNLLAAVFPGDRSRVRVADLGCLEGGFAVEFARMGFQVLGLDVREANIEACRHVKANVNLPNLEFVKDNAWNVAKYGRFDAVFCCGLLYHFDRPKQFLELISGVTDRLLIVQTHFAPDASGFERLRRIVPRFLKPKTNALDKYRLSPLTENESLQGRWFTEFRSDKAFKQRESSKWASWDNRRSFWIRREYLLQAIYDSGFGLVLEQFDDLGPDIVYGLTRGYHKRESRGMFIGIKTGSR